MHVSIVGFHVTSLKIQTTKLSIPPRFYFHDVLEQLKTNFHTNFRFKRVLEVGQESCHVGLKMTYFREFCYLNSLCVRKSIASMFTSSSKNKFTLL